MITFGVYQHDLAIHFQMAVHLMVTEKYNYKIVFNNTIFLTKSELYF